MYEWFSKDALSIARQFSDVGLLGLIGDRRKSCQDLAGICNELVTAINQNIDPFSLRQAVRCARYENSLGGKLCEKLSNAILRLPEPDITVVPLFDFALRHAYLHRTPEMGVIRMLQFLWAGCVGYGRPGARLPLPPGGITARLVVVPGDDYGVADFDEDRARGMVRHAPRWAR